MDVLVLGGTAFVGRAIVDDLVAHGHTPTLFTRGATNPDLFPDLARSQGDRDAGDYASVDGSRWDAVVDVSGYIPRHVGQSLDAVKAGRYLFISTVSVFDVATAPEEGLDEDGPRLAPVRTEYADKDYGGLKVACEDDLLTRLGDTATIVRPGIVAGPHDTTDRFTWWARRGRQGGRIAVPGRLAQPAQVVDSRDLARLCTVLLEGDTPGAYNAVGEQHTLEGLIRACGGTELVPVEPVERAKGFPLVVGDPSWDRLFRATPARARAAGLPVTPLATTAHDTAGWDQARGLPDIDRAFVRDQEAMALSGAGAG